METQEIMQFLQQLGQNETACVQAFQRCHYEYQDIGFAYYAGIKGDNWNKRAIAISGFFGQHQFTQWGYVFALSVLSLIPILVVFISCQRFFIEGLTAGSVKG